MDQGDVTITDIPTKMKGATIKQLQSDHELSEIPTSDPIDKELDDIVSFIAGRSPRDLELLASVHFWVDRQRGLEGKHLVDYILEKLTCLKPDARFSRSDVEHAIDVLESSGYLSR